MKKILLIAVLTFMVAPVSAKAVATNNQVDFLSKASVSSYSLFDDQAKVNRPKFFCPTLCLNDLKRCLSLPGASEFFCQQDYKVCLFDLCGIGGQP